VLWREAGKRKSRIEVLRVTEAKVLVPWIAEEPVGLRNLQPLVQNPEILVES
jgi:hypothetical protein